MGTKLCKINANNSLWSYSRYWGVYTLYSSNHSQLHICVNPVMDTFEPQNARREKTTDNLSKMEHALSMAPNVLYLKRRHTSTLSLKWTIHYVSFLSTLMQSAYLAQNIFPQSLQWCFRSVRVNSVLHLIQLLTASSNIQCSITPPMKIQEHLTECHYYYHSV